MDIRNLAHKTIARSDEIREVLRFDGVRRSVAVASCALIALVSGQMGALKYHDDSAEANPMALQTTNGPMLEIPIQTTTTTTSTIVESIVPETTTTTTTPGLLRAASAICKFEILSTKECIVPARLPYEISLKRFETKNPDELKQIYDLLDKVKPTPEGYQKFKIDTSRSHNLDEILSGEAVWPEIAVNHWVGYPTLCSTVDDCIERMKHGRKSYAFLTMADGHTYLIAPTPHSRTDHALGANYISAGNAGNANNVPTLTPEMLESMIYTELWMDHEYNRPMTREHSVSHAEIMRADEVTKVDWSSQLQDGFFARKQMLNHQVYVLGQGGQPSPLSP